ncbi:aminodeoxychorismate lyase, partial [Enterococcus mundtii]|nr:aminodeoxychorismate lyase [Enterococcus mundtii]
MANDNQNNQDPKSSLRDQVTGSLNGRNDGDQPDSSEKNDRSPQPSSDES